MKKWSVFVLCFFSLLSFFGRAENLVGSWEGRLALTPEKGLRIVLNISGDDDGSVTMDSPDQGAYGIAMSVDCLEEDSISVSYPQLSMKFSGNLRDGKIVGEFQQGGLRLPLSLAPKMPLSRPQTPQEPFNYKVQEVSFSSPLDGAKMNGTLTLPKFIKRDTPVAILVSGSGLQNRDEEVFDHKPFAVIADYLAKHGIAALRYDDRGYDSSTGLKPNETTRENAMDARGAIDFLKQKGYGHIGIIGHSEGGLVADILGADKGNALDFIIQLGGPAVSGDKILLYQNEMLLRDGGLPENIIDMYVEAMRGAFAVNKDECSGPFKEEDFEIFSAEWKDDPVVAPLANNLRTNFIELQPWVKFFISYDPVADMKKGNARLMMLYGEKDTQVPASLNVAALRERVPHARVKVYPDLNHLMQHCLTGRVEEYGQIEETMSEEVLADIVAFITE